MSHNGYVKHILHEKIRSQINEFLSLNIIDPEIASSALIIVNNADNDINLSPIENDLYDLLIARADIIDATEYNIPSFTRRWNTIKKTSEEEKTQAPETYIYNEISMEFRYIEPGSFIMGSSTYEVGHNGNEIQHEVTIERGHYIQTTPVTIEQWKLFINDWGYETQAEKEGGAHIAKNEQWVKRNGINWKKPGFEQTDESQPVTCITWHDTQAFINWLNERYSQKYRLPNDEEWEYACRAGTTSTFAFGNCLPADFANYNGKFPYNGCSAGINRNKTTPVKHLGHNNWNIYDMHGNVYEWCNNLQGSERLVRGGSWICKAIDCRSSCRKFQNPNKANNDNGFRVIREI